MRRREVCSQWALRSFTVPQYMVAPIGRELAHQGSRGLIPEMLQVFRAEEQKGKEGTLWARKIDWTHKYTSLVHISKKSSEKLNSGDCVNRRVRELLSASGGVQVCTKVAVDRQSKTVVADRYVDGRDPHPLRNGTGQNAAT